MNWLKKSLLTAATIFTLQSGFAQTFDYEARFSFLNAKLADMTYDKDDRKLSIDILHFVDVSFTYQMLNDSVYVETSRNRDLLEVFYYSKKDSSWVLEDYNVISGVGREDKFSLEGSVYNEEILTPIETLENLVGNNVFDTNKVVLFGIPYNIILENKDVGYFKSIYEGNILPYEQSSEDKFLLEDGLKVICEKEGNHYIPASFDATTKILQTISVGARVRRINGSKF